MKGAINAHATNDGTPLHGVTPKEYISDHGIRCVVKGGETYMDLQDVQRVLVGELEKRFPREIGPVLRAAGDARAAINEITGGMGGDMDNLSAKCGEWISRARQDRFAIVAEVRQIVTALNDIRSFLGGPKHDEEVARLEKFVVLCERLQALKAEGFLDKIIDTLVKL